MTNYTGSLYALIAFSLFAIHDVFIKFLTLHYLVFQIIFVSSLIAIPFTLLIIPIFSDITSLKPVYPKVMFFRVIILITTSACVFYAISSISLAEVYALLFSAPIIITALSHPLLREKVGWKRWSAVLFGFCGVLIVLQPNILYLKMGHLAAITAAFGIAIISILLRKVGKKERVALVLIYPLIGNVLIMGCISAFIYKPMPVEHLGLSTLVGIFSSTGMVFMIFAYRISNVVLVAPMQYSQIVWGSFLGWLLFSEKVEFNVVFGATIIISSGLFIVFREAQKNIIIASPTSHTR